MHAKGGMVQFAANGDTINRFENPFWGKPSLIDVRNPFNILLYYVDQGMVANLDRTLNVTDALALQSWGWYDVNAVGRSSDNHLWLFDRPARTIKKIDGEGNVLQAGNPIVGRGLAKFNPDKVWEQDSWIWAWQYDQYLLRFDQFGQLAQSYAVPSWRYVWIQDNQLYFAKATQWYTQPIEAEESNPIDFLAPTVGMLAIGRSIIVVADGQEVWVLQR